MQYQSRHFLADPRSDSFGVDDGPEQAEGFNFHRIGGAGLGWYHLHSARPTGRT